MNRIIIISTFVGLAHLSQALTLDEALRIAWTNSPKLHAAYAYEQAANRSVDAAGLWGSPELEFEGEGIGGDHDDFDDGEYTVSLKQAIPLGRKSNDERAIARQAVQVSTHAASEAELEVAAEVRAAFAEALAQQEIFVVRNEQEKLGMEFVAVAKDRHHAGGSSEMEVVQADLALEEILLEKQCCFGDLDAAKKELALILGVPLDELGILTGDFYHVETSDLTTVDLMHPELQRLRAEVKMAFAEADLTKSQNAGDLKVAGGVKYEEPDDAASFVMSVSVPLSFGKKGRLERMAALLRADAVSAHYEQRQRTLQQELSKIVQTYQRSMAEIEKYKTHMLPMAEQAYTLSRRGYDVGRYSWLELLTAQQNLARIRVRYIEALLVAHKASAELNQFKIGGE